MRLFWLALISVIASTSFAEGKLDLTDDEIAQQILEDLAKANEESVPTNVLGKLVPRNFATLRFLDRLNGTVRVIEIGRDQSLKVQHLLITQKACFVPASDGSSDALVYLNILDERETVPVFDGWMLASSPALSALEHSRYDVWAVSCSDDAMLSMTDEEMAPLARPETLGEGEN